jgi:two-component system cell cycle response regulator
MVLGPVIIGAIFVGSTATQVSTDRATQRLGFAASALRTSIGALCGQLLTVAEVISSTPDDRRLATAAQFVQRGLATGVHIDRGATGETTAMAPPPPWADCSGPDSGGHEAVAGYEAIAARVALPDGVVVSAAVTVDESFVRRLSGAAGVALTVLPGDAEPDEDGQIVGLRPVSRTEPLPPVFSTLASDEAIAVAGVATSLGVDAVGRTEAGALVRRIGPVAGQPLPVAISVNAELAQGTHLILIFVVLLTALAAIVVAWWLARTATSPLAGLAQAAEKVAAGDLQTRVPVTGNDEIGRLATAFNHMTRELETYVTALTASRDQLRGHLGVLGDTLSSTHDLDRILTVILQTARHATGASGGVVLLAENGELAGKCVSEMDLDMASLRVPIGEGLVGSVAATGVPRMGRVDRDGPRLSPGEPPCESYMVVPFSAPGLAEAAGIGPALPAARGVLALYGNEFTDQDLVTLRTFAGQAAVAVDNVRVHEEAQRLSVTDSLTGLFNYRSLRETLRREADRAGRFGRKLSVLALDLDHFKEINDRFGHAAGDAVLAEFAQRIRYEIREVDVAFRQGGEEFVILLPETDDVGGIAVAERLCDAVRRAQIMVLDDLSVPVTVSIGIAVLPDHGTSGPAVLRAADEALYAAKTSGRDTFRLAGEALCAIGNSSNGVAGGPQAPRQASGR